MSGLVEFLRARLDEEEQTAQLGGPGRIAWLTYRHADGDLYYTTVGAADDVDGPWVAAGEELPSPASVRVVYEPARVLADVAVKRKIVEWVARMGHYAEDPDRWACPNPDEVLELLALPYASHPDYREEWKP